jgi:hypothetical protein
LEDYNVIFAVDRTYAGGILSTIKAIIGYIDGDPKPLKEIGRGNVR